MANIRINAIATTATSMSSDDYFAIDGTTLSTRKMSAATPAFTTVLTGNGTVAAPSVSFASDQDTGLYRIGANNIGVAANGAKVLDIATAGLSIDGVLSLVKNAAYASTIEGAQTVAATGNSFLFKNSGATTLLTLAYDATATFAGAVTVTGAATFAGAATIAGTVIHTLSATPATSTATGTVGTISWDSGYIYICTSANTWKRVAIGSW